MDEFETDGEVSANARATMCMGQCSYGTKRYSDMHAVEPQYLSILFVFFSASKRERERRRERVRVCVCCFASSRRACFRCRSFKVLHMHLRPAYSNGATSEVYPNHDCLPTTATPGNYPVHVAVAGPPCSRGLRQPPAQACSTLKLLLECPRHGNSSLHCRVSCSSPSLALLLMLPHGRNHCDGQRDDGLVIERTASTTQRGTKCLLIQSIKIKML